MKGSQYIFAVVFCRVVRAIAGINRLGMVFTDFPIF